MKHILFFIKKKKKLGRNFLTLPIYEDYGNQKRLIDI